MNYRKMCDTFLCFWKVHSCVKGMPHLPPPPYPSLSPPTCCILLYGSISQYNIFLPITPVEHNCLLPQTQMCTQICVHVIPYLRFGGPNRTASIALSDIFCRCIGFVIPRMPWRNVGLLTASLQK